MYVEYTTFIDGNAHIDVGNPTPFIFQHPECAYPSDSVMLIPNTEMENGND